MQRMSWIVVAALMAACCVAAATEPDADAEVHRLGLSGRIQIDAEGQVVDYRIRQSLRPALRQLIDRGIRDLRFEPLADDGNPVAASTPMHLGFVFEPHGDDYRVRLESAHFGGFEHVGISPRYPEAALRDGVGADVLVAVRVGADGHVLEAAAIRTRLSREGSSAQQAAWRNQFEASALRALRGHRFEDSDELHLAVEQTVLLPVKYTVTDTWATFHPAPQRPIPWTIDTDGEAEDSIIAALEAGDGSDAATPALALNPSVRLKPDEIGKLL